MSWDHYHRHRRRNSVMPASTPPRVENGSASLALPAHAQLRRCHVPHAQMHREGSDQPRKPRCGWIWRTNTCISKRESVISPANSPSSNTHGKFIEPPIATTTATTTATTEKASATHQRYHEKMEQKTYKHKDMVCTLASSYMPGGTPEIEICEHCLGT